MVPSIREEVLHGPEQVGAEPSTARIDCGQSAPGQQAREEFLGQLTSTFLIPSFAAEEPKHRLPIGRAQIAERLPRLGGIAPRA